MSLEPSLPIELLYAVLDQIDDKDIPTLGNCALVCHVFHSACRKKMFANIELTLCRNQDSNYLPHLRQLKELLTSSTGDEIASCARKLIVYTVKGTANRPNSEDGFPEQCSVLSSILLCFHDLHDFRMRGSATWYRLTPCLRHALVECFVSNPITCLFIGYGNRGFPLPLLNCFSHLKELSFFPRRTSSRTSSIPSNLPKGKVKLDFVNLASRVVAEWIIKEPSCRLDISEVKTLVWRHIALQGLLFLRDLSSTLQNLILTVEYKSEVLSSVIPDLERLPHLQHLELSMWPLLNGCADTLILHPQNHLKSLKLELDSLCLNPEITSQWDKVDRRLTEANLSTLESLEIGEDSSKSDVKEFVERNLPRLNGRVKLKFDYHWDFGWERYMPGRLLREE